jgi:Short C-terminal domain/GRAM domain
MLADRKAQGEKGMSKQDNKHLRTFEKDKLIPEETMEADLKGWLDKKTGQNGFIQHNGQLVLTNKRVCFYSEAPFEEIFETIPLSKITSVEASSLMGYRVIRIHTAHDDLEFKTLEPKALFDKVLAHLERLRNEPTGSPVAPADSVTEQIKKLGELRDSGLLTDDEFNSKKAQLLARL